jgi:hypothetical protein
MPSLEGVEKREGAVLYRRLILLALIIAPATAAAQFTTYIPPKSKVKDSIKAVVAAQQKARTDSTNAAALTNMKTWVDSAAGVVVPRTDSVAASIAAADTTTFANGSKAPMTASSLPLLTLIGISALGFGALLLRTPRRRVRA